MKKHKKKHKIYSYTSKQLTALRLQMYKIGYDEGYDDAKKHSKKKLRDMA